MPTIGQKLEETRLNRGLSVEDVAHETRIHPNMILQIEEDDFSQFPSVAYAKSFIRKYSNHLGVDLSEAMEALNSGVTARLRDNELMGEMQKTIKKDRRFRLEHRIRDSRPSPGKPGGAPLFLNFILGALMVSLGLFYFLGYNASTPQKAKEDIARGLGIPLSASAETEVLDPSEAVEANPLKPDAPGADLVTPAADPDLAAKPTVPTAAPESADETTTRLETDLPGTPPVYPVIKPEVRLQLDDTLSGTPLPPGSSGPPPLEGATSLRPRGTLRVEIADEPQVAPLRAGDLPAVRKPGPEPQAVLRPEGTDPAATTKREEEPVPPPPSPSKTSATGGGARPTAPPSPLRAVPVAASE